MDCSFPLVPTRSHRSFLAGEGLLEGGGRACVQGEVRRGSGGRQWVGHSGWFPGARPES